MRAAVSIAAIVVVAFPAQSTQQPTSVAVAVEHRDGRPVEDLTAEDFSLLLDGQAAPVLNATYDSTGLNVALLLDLTASTVWPGGEYVGSVAGTIQEHVLSMFSDDTAVIFGTFGRAVRWSGGFSPDRSQQRRSLRAALELRREERSGPSPIWDAVSDALATLHSRQGRKAVFPHHRRSDYR